MKCFKLTNNKFVALVGAASIAFALAGCTPAKQANNTNSGQAQNIISQTLEAGINESIRVTDNIKQDIYRIEADAIIEDYINTLSTEFNELINFTVDQWNSEEFQEKLAVVRQKLRDLVDFAFNGKEINGVTFDELSDTAKEKVNAIITTIDTWLNNLIPNYQDRLYDGLVNLGADGLELWNELNESFNNYQSDVLDEFYNRSNNRIIIKK